MEKYMETDLRYLKSLANQYPTVAAAATEIINLQAILSLPKGTEHFITDIHGEYDQFQHVIRNGSGAIKRKIEEEFGNAISAGEKKAIATLIYYPEQKLEQVLKTEENMEDWYKVSLYRLIRICKSASSKYTRSKVRKALPKDFAYVIEELLTGRPDVSDQEAYYNEIIRSVIRTGRAPELVIAFCNLIRRLVVDHLHVVGDIFDRGPYPNLIMDTFAALALASIPPSESVMKEKPRKSTDFIITKSMRNYILGMGVVFLALLMGMLFRFNNEEGGMTVQRLTIFFTFFVMLQFWNLFNAKSFGSGHSAFHNIKGSGLFFTVALVILVVQILIVEFGGLMFQVTPLPLTTILWCLLCTMPIMLVAEVYHLLKKIKK